MTQEPPASGARGPARLLLGVLGVCGLVLAFVVWTRLRFVPPLARGMIIVFECLTLALVARLLVRPPAGDDR